jgi:hypothetical protein
MKMKCEVLNEEINHSMDMINVDQFAIHPSPQLEFMLDEIKNSSQLFKNVLMQLLFQPSEEEAKAYHQR